MLFMDSGPYALYLYAGWPLHDHFLQRDFGPNRIIFMNVCVVIKIAMVMILGNFWDLWDNIYDCVYLLL
jgi:hypothetical protein